MTITRTINGETVTIKLTTEEIAEAYKEEQAERDFGLVTFMAESIEEDREVEEFTTEELREVADELRDAMDNDWYIWSGDQIDDYITNHLLELRK